LLPLGGVRGQLTHVRSKILVGALIGDKVFDRNDSLYLRLENKTSVKSQQLLKYFKYSSLPEFIFNDCKEIILLSIIEYL